MASSRIKEFYWKFYKNRSASFLSNLYKSSITGNEKDIHRLRLDMKKLVAVLDLFEMLDPEQFDRQNFELFRSLFKFSGKIRELQVNQLILTRFNFSNQGIIAFQKYLQLRENKLTRQFIDVVRRFDEKSLKKSEKKIKNLCNKINAKILIPKSEKFLLKKAGKIAILRTFPNNPENIHGIRKNLKAMVTVLTLVAMVYRNDKRNELLGYCNHTEVMIGNWHDHQVLMEYIDQFLLKVKKTEEEERLQIIAFRNFLFQESKMLLEKMLPEFVTVLDAVNVCLVASKHEENKDMNIQILNSKENAVIENTERNIQD